MFSRPGHGTATTQTFWFWDDTSAGGVAGVLINGVQAAETVTLNAGNGYLGSIEVSVSGAFTWQATLDGVAVGPQESLDAFPATGTKLLVSADASVDSPTWYYMQREAPDLHVMNGDVDYIDGTYTTGTALVTIRADHANIVRKQTQRMLALRKMRNVFMWDNHEVLGSPPLANPGDAFYDDVAWPSFLEWWACTNPVNTDSGTHDLGYPVPYFAQKVGDIEYIQLDATSWAAGNRPNSAQYDATQMTWAAARIAASTASVVVVLSPVNLVNRTDFTPLMEAIDATSKTVILCVADLHGARATYYDVGCTSGTTNATTWFVNRGLLLVEGTPVQHPTTGTVGQCPTNGDVGTELFKDNNSPGSSPAFNCNYNYTVIESHPNGDGVMSDPHVYVAIKSGWSGRVRWQGRIKFGEREPVPPNENGVFIR